MTDPADRHLEERLHALAGGVHAPIVPADQDVRRGRRRLFRMRLALAGASTGTLAIVLGVTGLTAGDPTATDPPVVSQPPSASFPATPDSSPVDDEDKATSSDDADGGDRAGAQDGDGDAAGRSGDRAGDGSTTGKVGDDTSGGPGGDGGGSTLEGTGGGPQPGADPSLSSDPDPTPTETPSSTPSDLPTELPSDVPTTAPTVPPTPTTPTTPPTTPPVPPVPPTVGKVKVHKVLSYFNDVVAEHVDADRAHLQDYDRTVDERSATRLDGALFALGSTYRWEDGDDTSDLAVRVATGWDQVPWQCGTTPSTWSCRAADGAEVASHDGVREVAVEHDDGQVIVVATDLPARELSDDALVAAAGDDRLVVPGDAPLAPLKLDTGAFGASGQAAMVRDGEAFATTAYSRTPLVRGTWTVDGVSRGTLGWTAVPTYSGTGWECLTTFRSCTDVLVGDQIVHVGLLKKKAGWVVQYDGPQYAVRVTSSDPKAAKKRAYPFVTDPGWQPVR